MPPVPAQPMERGESTAGLERCGGAFRPSPACSSIFVVIQNPSKPRSALRGAWWVATKIEPGLLVYCNLRIFCGGYPSLVSLILRIYQVPAPRFIDTTPAIPGFPGPA